MAIQQYNSSKSYPRTCDISSHKMLTIIIVPERKFFHVEQVSNLIRKQLVTLDSPATTVLVGVACLADEYYIIQGSVLDKTIGIFFSPSITPSGIMNVIKQGRSFLVSLRLISYILHKNV